MLLFASITVTVAFASAAAGVVLVIRPPSVPTLALVVACRTKFTVGGVAAVTVTFWVCVVKPLLTGGVAVM